ncbi:kelch repeat protein, partial [Oesophagostomum dentatum]
MSEQLHISFVIPALGGADLEDGTLAEVEKYDPVRRQWVTAEPLLARRKKFGLAVHNSKIYIAGGVCDDAPEPVATVHMYDWCSSQWTAVANMPTARCSLSLAALDNKLYACGGETNAPVNVVE